jgi:multiple sugar transport system permease protein
VGEGAGGHEVSQRRLIPLLFLVVPVGLLFVFTYLPVAEMFRYSTTNWDGLSKTPRSVGLENYGEVVTRPDLFGVFSVSLYYLGGALVQLALAMYFATVLSFNVRFRNLFKGMLFFPYLINGVAIGFIFLYFFRPEGVLDSLIAGVGLGGHETQWLGDRGVINYSLTGVSIWRYLGLNFVLFLGAIQSIPAELYEAAEIDGSNRWQQFRYIIAPGIKPVIGLSVILAVQGALNVFEIPYVMTGGANGSSTFVIQTVEMAFKFHKVGLASAMAVVLLAIILLITAVQRVFLKDRALESFT